MKLKIKKVHPRARLPEYAHPGDAGLDLFSVEDAELKPGCSRLIRTGIAIGQDGILFRSYDKFFVLIQSSQPFWTRDHKISIC